MSSENIYCSSSFSLVVISFSKNLKLHTHDSSLAKTAFQNLCISYTPDVFYTYKIQIHSKKRAASLNRQLELTDHLPPLIHKRKLGDLELFYRYCNADYSQKLTNLVPTSAITGRLTHLLEIRIICGGLG